MSDHLIADTGCGCPFATEMFQGPYESWERYLARMRAMARAGTPKRGAKGRPRIDRTAVLALLSADAWTPTAEIATALGITQSGVSKALCRLRQRGAAIESRGRGGGARGWRIRAEAAA